MKKIKQVFQKNYFKESEHKPNFILWNTRISNEFKQTCQNFQNEQNFISTKDKDWLIIDNDTGQIIYPDK